MEVYLSIGTNIGNKEENIRNAILKIGNFFDIVDISSIYITSPVGFKDQPDFLNLVIKIKVNKSDVSSDPERLLKILKNIEVELGRKKTFRWGPRLIDIDILLIDSLIYSSKDLEIPHKEFIKRNFVLIPLSDLVEEIKIGEKSFKIKNLVDKSDLIQNPVSLYMEKEKVKNWIINEQ